MAGPSEGVAIESTSGRPARRCFLFTYTWIGATRAGNGNLWLCSEKFPAQQVLKDAAKNNCPEEASIVITGWNEFANESDYAAFVGEVSNKTAEEREPC